MYENAKKSAISLTNQAVCQGTLIKKDDATRAKDNKRKYDGRSMGNSS